MLFLGFVSPFRLGVSSRVAKRGGVSNGGVSRSGLVLPFLCSLGLSRFFWDFPDLSGDCPGIFKELALGFRFSCALMTDQVCDGP